MRVLIAAFLCLFASASYAEPPLPLPTVTGTKIHIVTSQVRMYANNLVWGGTHLGAAGNYGVQPGSWVTVDARPWFDSSFATNAIGVYVSGISIITSPNAGEVPDLHVTFARPSDPVASCAIIDRLGAGYIFQATIQGFGGVRSNGATMIPVENGQFKMCYSVSTSGNYPSNASYGLNFTPQFWVE